MFLGVGGFIRQKSKLTTRLSNAKLGWWPMDIINNSVLIIQKHSVLLWNHSLYNLLFLLLLLEDGHYDNSTFKMYFYMKNLFGDIYMQQPQEFVDTTKPTYICKSCWAIYGLKQALRAWFAQLSTWLLDFSHLKQTPHSSFFIISTLNIFFLVYVDGIVITVTSQKAIDTLIGNLGRAFSMKDLGRLSYFLVVEVNHTTLVYFSLNAIHS